MKSLRYWVVLALLLGGLGACTPSPLPPTVVPPTEPQETPVPQTDVPTPTPTAEPLAARVNGEPITLVTYQRALSWYETSLAAGGQDPSSDEGQLVMAEARVHILEGLIEQTLIIQAATEAGIVVSDDEVTANIQGVVQQIGQATFDQRLASEGLSLEEVRYQIWRSLMIGKIIDQVTQTVPARAEHVRARHIQLSTEAEAQQVITQLQAGADFGALARAYSQDRFTREEGGDLGYFSRGILTAPEVEAVAFALEPGQISTSIPSQLGYHIIQVVERTPEMDISPDNMRLLQDAAREDWVAGLWGQAQIERFITP